MARPRRAPAALLSAILSVGALALPASTAGGDLSEATALGRGRDHAARLVKATRDSLVQLTSGSAPLVIGGHRYATAVFADRSLRRQAFVAVDLASGAVLDAAAFARLTAAAERAADRFSPPARDALRATRDRPVLLAYALRPVDYGPAVRAVSRAHRDVTWDGDRPVSKDAKLSEQRRLDVLTAKAGALAKARIPFVEAAEAAGAEIVATLDLVPLVYLRTDARTAERLARHPAVGQVLLPDTWDFAMNAARPTIDADLADKAGWDGTGVKLGIVEYSYVSWSHTGMTSVPRVARRVSSDGRSCLSGRGTNADSTNHMTWVTAIAASRASSLPGVANSVSIVESSANSGAGLASSDARILKAVECAVRAGATVINLSIVQNSASNYSTSNRFLDELVDVQHITVVAASGDHGPSSDAPKNPEHCRDGKVRSPASGWNVVAVGGINDRGTGGTSDDRLWWRSDGTGPAYCWGNPAPMSWDATNDRVKPELSAPAAVISTSTGHRASGTSAASPMVAAAAATVQEHDPALRYEPERVRAILVAASAVDRTPRPSGTFTTEYEGWGSLNVMWSNRIVDRGASGSNGRLDFNAITDAPTGGTEPDPSATPAPSPGSGTDPAASATCPAGLPGSQQVTFEGRAGKTIRFVVTWNSHNVGGVDSRTTDYTLTVRNPAGNAVGVSARVASNYEVVELKVDDKGGPGTYTAEITPVRWQCNPASERVGWAWVGF